MYCTAESALFKENFCGRVYHHRSQSSSICWSNAGQNTQVSGTLTGETVYIRILWSSGFNRLFEPCAEWKFSCLIPHFLVFVIELINLVCLQAAPGQMTISHLLYYECVLAHLGSNHSWQSSYLLNTLLSPSQQALYNVHGCLLKCHGWTISGDVCRQC